MEYGSFISKNFDYVYVSKGKKEIEDVTQKFVT
jgi:hypothetical protein